MNRKSIIVALIVSLGVSMVLWKQLQNSQKPSDLTPVIVEAPKIPTVMAIVAKKRIAPMIRIEKANIEDLFEMKEIVASSCPSDAIATMSILMNRYTGMGVLAGDVMTVQRLLDKDAVFRLSRAIPPGRRAFTIKVDPVMGTAGFIQQGDVVDIVATFRPAGSEMVSKVILQDIKILAVGKTYLNEMAGGAASNTAAIMSQITDLITMAVTPDEMERLMYIDSAGISFRLVLKNQNDQDKPIVTPGATEKLVLKTLQIDSQSIESKLGLKPETPSTPIPVIITAPVAPVVAAPPDDGKVVVHYGSKRKEEMYKDGYQEGMKVADKPQSSQSGTAERDPEDR